MEIAIIDSTSTARLEAKVKELCDFATSPNPGESAGLTPALVIEICTLAAQHFRNQSSLLEIATNVEGENPHNLVIFGDLHGNLKSLGQILQNNGSPNKNTKYLGLGDYVSRGSHSVEVFVLLMGLAVLHPTQVFLLRGGHESQAIAKVYGFQEELTHKGLNTPEVREAFWTVFNHLPLAAVVNNKYFCVHGGISPALLNTAAPLDVIRNKVRGQDVPEEGLITDLLYADPLAEPAEGFQMNPRGIGQCFGRDVLQQFLTVSNLKALVRSREYIRTGFNSVWDNTILNVFSSCNYMRGDEPTGFYKLEPTGELQGHLTQ